MNIYKLLILPILIISLPGCLHQSARTTKKQSSGARYIDTNKPIKEMTKEEIRTFKQEKKDDKELLIKINKRILEVETDSELVRQTTLETAQLALDKKDWELAQKYSTDYQQLYPGTPQAQQAALIHIHSLYGELLSPDKDQTKTQLIIDAIQKFLTLYPKAEPNVKEMRKVCYQHLIEHELHVARHYLNKYNFSHALFPLNAALRRIAYIKEKLLPHLPTYEEKVLLFELELNEKSLNTKGIQELKDLLAKKFPSRISAS
jgi:outer membrane protein assembly factor BamD (BamD/ComL family)